MRNRLRFISGVNFIFLVASFLFFLFSFLDQHNPLSCLNYQAPAYNGLEQFDPGLSRITKISKLEAYCDSLYAKTDSLGGQTNAYTYANIASGVIRERFYWGYSCYSASSNYLALLLSHASYWGYDAVVDPNDIMKYNYAACSQQSIVMMELLRRKSIPARKVGFQGSQGGHFALEAFYEGGWHFYDPTLEPDTAILNRYHRPCISYLVSHPDVLIAAYSKGVKNRSYVEDILMHPSYGKTDTFPAPVALIFHKSTKVLSDIAYLIFLLVQIALVKATRRYSKTMGNS